MAYDPLNLPDNAIPEGTDISHIEEGMNELSNSLAESNIFGLGTAIQSGDDLDSFTTPGRYYCSGSSVAANVNNTPVTNTGYSLFVFYTAGTSRFVQIALVSGTGDTLQYRVYTGAGWSAWRIISYT